MLADALLEGLHGQCLGASRQGSRTPGAHFASGTGAATLRTRATDRRRRRRRRRRPRTRAARAGTPRRRRPPRPFRTVLRGSPLDERRHPVGIVRDASVPAPARVASSPGATLSTRIPRLPSSRAERPREADLRRLGDVVARRTARLAPVDRRDHEDHAAAALAERRQRGARHVKAGEEVAVEHGREVGGVHLSTKRAPEPPTLLTTMSRPPNALDCGRDDRRRRPPAR